MPKIAHLADLTPPSLDRTWLTAPHPTLPLAATCCADKTVRVYSLSNFRLQSTITGGHKRSVRSCAWKPQGRVKGESVLATGSFDSTVGIWRRWDRYPFQGSMQEDEENTSNNNNNNNHDDLSMGDEDREEEEDEEEEEWRFAVLLDGHDSEVKSVSWSPSGSFLATCARDKSIWIWEDLDDGDNNFETVAVLQEHTGDVKCVAWHPNEECLASASYDDTIRIWREDVDDWGQVACLKGHEGTVWYIDWEAARGLDEGDEDAREATPVSGPRLVSCSADRTVRIWRRRPKAQPTTTSSSSSGIPSIIRPINLDETWDQQAILPAAHDLPIYAVSWNKRTGRVASTGADGRIVVYEERAVADTSSSEQQTNGEEMQVDGDGNVPKSEWTIIASLDAAHGIYEVNHIVWAKRADRGRANDDEEVLITTADDGSVKVWTIG
ncbi:hypothetical protein VTN31DRAFT_4036 [Thermomyces dupontii]|uniref:uncharacterized protein n=1 Tax=Talaromyces thermophilus TaxID=28565 RepID=UPI003742CD17